MANPVLFQNWDTCEKTLRQMRLSMKEHDRHCLWCIFFWHCAPCAGTRKQYSRYEEDVVMPAWLVYMRSLQKGR